MNAGVGRRFRFLRGQFAELYGCFLQDNCTRVPCALATANFRTSTPILCEGSALDQHSPSNSHGGQNASCYFTETDAVVIALTPAGDRQAIAVFEPFPRLTVRQLERIRAAPR